MIKIALADDQAMIRMALATLLQLEPDIEVVGQVGDCASALALAASAGPDVLLMDVQMPAGVRADGRPGPADGIAATAELLAVGGPTRVIVLTTFGRAGYLRRTMEAGASGFMVKDAPAERLVEGIRRVAQGLRVVDPELAAASLTLGPSPLSEKEAAVLRQAADGASTAQIAKRLYLSQGTVRNHISAAIGKLGVPNRADAIRRATENGWL